MNSKHSRLTAYLDFWHGGEIVLYTSSRIIASFLPRAETPKDWPAGKPKPTDKSWFAAYATITWGVVMYLHQYRRETIQTGMVNSMDCKLLTLRVVIACALRRLRFKEHVTDSPNRISGRALKQIFTTMRRSGTACGTYSGTTSETTNVAAGVCLLCWSCLGSMCAVSTRDSRLQANPFVFMRVRVCLYLICSREFVIARGQARNSREC